MLNQVPKQIVIIGGGASVKEGIQKGLWKKISSKWTIGLNYSFNYFDSTMLCYVDNDFYNKQIEKLEKLPLIVGKTHKFKCLPNTIMLNTGNKYIRDLSTGVYKSSLVGIFALSLSIYLLNEGEIFLLGYDYGELRTEKFTKELKNPKELKEVTVKDKKNRAITHFYQGKIEHRGVGKVSYYNSHGRAKNDFKVYKNENEVKIYNVSLVSKITQFPKISYEEFFKKLDGKSYNQDIIRKVIIQKLESKRSNK